MRRLKDRRNRLLLLAGLMHDVPEIGDANWRDTVFWKNMMALADANGVVTVLPGALRRANLWNAVPGDLREHLEAVHYLNTSRTEAQRKEALSIHDAFSSAGIDCVFLKGAAYLFSGLYADDPAIRITTDIDVLVREESIPEAEAALAKLGYSSTTHARNDLDRDDHQRHHRPALVPKSGQGQFSVELHAQISALPWREALPAEEIFERSDLKMVAGRNLRLPSPTDMLLHALIHAAKTKGYHLRRCPLRDAIDINRLWLIADTDPVEAVQTLSPKQKSRLYNFLDACLTLQGNANSSPVGNKRRSYYDQVLFWSGFERNEKLENWAFSNGQLLITHPVEFFMTKPAKLFDPQTYRNIKGRLNHRKGKMR
jgi:hypothetical protein